MLARLIIPLSILFVVMTANAGRSAIVLRVDMDPVAAGVQTNIIGTPGATITAGLFMELTGTTSLSGYNYSIQYDSNELTFQSRMELPSNLTGLSELDSSNPNDVGLLQRFDGGTFNLAGGPTGPFGPVKVGEILFTVKTPSGTASDIDVIPGRFEPTADRSFDNNFAEVTTSISYFGGSVSVASIPEPTSLTLVVGSCFAIVLRRRIAN